MSEGAGDGRSSLRRGGHALVEKAKKAANRFTQTEHFKKLCQRCYEEVDIDGSGQIDMKEIYCAVLLLYVHVGKVVSAASPPPRKRVAALFAEVDIDKSATLSKDEFEALAVVLCEEIAGRIAVETFFTLCIGPIVAAVLVNLIMYTTDFSALGSVLAGVAESMLYAAVVCAVCTALMPRAIAAYTARVDSHTQQRLRKDE
eukprot:TRINITY_DN30196_c0_g1_i1.p1 TRINITY_DN30196_c0_g1~~TRINITY_DN30196_c0_g1_i1.p1  ORF type:complete len:229 (+),score=100.64 TRINITY_DN30196_c0_g1_i1:86-688(+)